CAICSVYEAYW
nr:immunoglobulin heavy chain junction region [Mus musculus]